MRETQNLQVPYYVDKHFENNYKGEELEELEKHIEKDYIDYIQTSCRKEKQQSKGAGGGGGGELYGLILSELHLMLI